MAERIEPPPARIEFLCLAERSRGAPLREYVLRQQADAVQALLNTATTPATVLQVQRVLAELARDGTSNAAAAWLLEQAPAGPARIRQAAAFGELPAALDARMQPGCGGSYRGLLGRTHQPLGELALSDYQHAAEQESADPWIWLALAWLGDADPEHALQMSLATAATLSPADARRIQIFALQELALLRHVQGRSADAQAVAKAALQLARQGVDELGGEPAAPGTEPGWRDFGQAGNALAAELQALGHNGPAREVLGEVLPVQQRLAALQPDDLAIQYTLIDMLLRLAVLRDRPPADAGAATRIEQAEAVYAELQRRLPEDSIAERAAWPGTFSPAAASAGMLVLLLGVALLRRLRRRAARVMRATPVEPGALALRRASPTPTYARPRPK